MPDTDGDRVWGMTRPLKVHEHSAAKLPWLAPLLTENWNSEREQLVKLVALSRLLGVAPPNHQPHPIAAIIVLGERSVDGHRMCPLSKSDMLVAIASDNIGRSLEGVSWHQQTRMQRIADLVMATPGFRFNAGTDLETLPGALLAGLR